MAKKINFKSSTFAHLKHELRQDILTSGRSLPNLRKEISRVFQVANRRIQNIESSGKFSPAVISLGKGDITSYSKFSLSDKSWYELKKEYTKAITFLRQPTSTLGGTRGYNDHLRDTYDLTQDEYDIMSDQLQGKLMSISESDYVERYLMRYKDFTGDLEASARDISEQIESEAVTLVNELDASIETEARDVFEERSTGKFAPRTTMQEWENIFTVLDDLRDGEFDGDGIPLGGGIIP